MASKIDSPGSGAPLAIFDVDGTIVDSQDGIVEAQRRAFSAVGLPIPSRQRSLSVVGLSLDEAFRALVGPEGPVSRLAEAYREAWLVMRASAAYEEPLFAGADTTLRALRDIGFRIGIATGKSRRGVARLIAERDWDAIFDVVQTADDAPSKPAPDMILQALQATDTAAGNAFMIGDTSFDMLMAHAAGVEAVGVTWGYHAAGALQAAGARVLVNDFQALLAYLAPHRAGRKSTADV